MLKRLTFKCWNCDREYSMTRDLKGIVQLIVECPFCEKEAVVDLAPYRANPVTLFKDVEAAATTSSAEQTFDLPAVLPTQPPKG